MPIIPVVRRHPAQNGNHKAVCCFRKAAEPSPGVLPVAGRPRAFHTGLQSSRSSRPTRQNDGSFFGKPTKASILRHYNL